MTAPATEAQPEERMKPKHLRRTLYWLALDYLHIAN